MSASLSLFDKEHTSREKYIYFLCGVSGALVAYLGKDYTPHNPWTLHDTLTISTLACLVCSFVFGLARVLTYIEGLSINREGLAALEEMGSCVDSKIHHIANKDKGIPITLNKKTGKPYTLDEIEKRISELNIEIPKLERRFKRLFFWSTFFLCTCHVFLIAGFVLLLWSKLPSTGIIPREVSSTSTHLSVSTNLHSAFTRGTK